MLHCVFSEGERDKMGSVPLRLVAFRLVAFRSVALGYVALGSVRFCYVELGFV